MRYCRKLYFCGIKVSKVWFPSVPPRKKSHFAFSRAKIRARAPVPCWSNSFQHQTSLVCIPSCNPSVHCMWGPQVHMAMEETWANARKPSLSQEHKKVMRKLCLGGYIFPNFHMLASVPRCDWQVDTFPMPPQLYWACIYLPFVGSLPSVFGKE